MPEKDVITYSLKFILTNLITFLLILLIGITTDNLYNILLSALSFSLLRVFSGGFHINNPDLCIASSLIIVYSISNISQFTASNYNLFFGLVSLILVIIFAPSRIEEHSIINKNKHYIFKIISIMIIIIGFLSKNEIIQFSFFIQSLTLIHLRLKGGEINE
ncbi:accessory gene regulator B family protein [Paenibacillus tianjinensis]|uniref:Accessory gene regulator B family protein n=2 Tax=Paenibacillus tianjinensis TaxID=2810347 RepID=A0ABX7L9R9_9BACL|nr:accessory gene regulator B family protein [Paenibacillus tianjinensis]QSF43469.1 accessory gene regulator B family protein [Paenibacillus tianjinensis]